MREEEVRAQIDTAKGLPYKKAMKCCFLFLAAILMTGRALAADVTLMDVSDPSHPKSIEDQVGAVKITSWSNDNTCYTLQMQALHRFTVSSDKILLTVGKHEIRFNSVGIGSGGGVTNRSIKYFTFRWDCKKMEA